MERIYVPGEKEWRTQETYRRDGIPLDEPTWTGLIEAARRVGLASEALERLSRER